MVQAGERLAPLIESLREHLLLALLIHMDKTPHQVNAEPDRPACSSSYMRVQRGAPPGEQILLYHYAPADPARPRRRY